MMVDGLLTRARRAAARLLTKGLPVMSPANGSWQTLFAGPPGWWQADLDISTDSVLQNPTVYACVTQIANDIGKLGLRLMQQNDVIWEETASPAFSGVLRRPNHFQTRQKFIESWIISKLTAGNFYALKARDARGVVTALYPLDPQRVTPLVSTSGLVFYRLGSDTLAGMEYDIPAAPASEIIHDTMECLFHPLVGVSPIYASGLAAMQGINIQKGSANFFKNGSRPGGILSAPEEISDEAATRIKDFWEKNYRGDGAGRVAVLGDGLKYEALSMNAVDAQLIEQLKWSEEKICSVFKVPPYKVYVGSLPTYDNAEVLNRIYYDSCLQRLIESIEDLLDDGLALPSNYRTEFDLEDLLRMDTSSRVDTAAKAVSAAIMTPNEARRRFGLPPKPGGDSPYLQVQNFSLEALARRDAQSDPFSAKNMLTYEDAESALGKDFQGPWMTDVTYKSSHFVMLGAGLWKCNRETTDRPGESTAWTLIACPRPN